MAPPPLDLGTCAHAWTNQTMCRTRKRVQVWDDAWHDLTAEQQQQQCLEACATVAKTQPDVTTCCGGNFDAAPWCYAYRPQREGQTDVKTMRAGKTFRTAMCPPVGGEEAAARDLQPPGGASGLRARGR